MLNFSLMARWQNWGTILAMVFIASFAINAIAKRFTTET